MDTAGPEPGPGPGPYARVTVCESCGAPDDDLAPVHRVYLETDGHGQVIGTHVLPDVERWCLVCRTHYPHEAAGRS